MSPKQSLSLIEQMKIQPAHNNFTNEDDNIDPYNPAFSKTDMSSVLKNGSLDFGDLKSGASSGFGESPSGFESEKVKQSSPRSPVGRKDKRVSL